MMKIKQLNDLKLESVLQTPVKREKNNDNMQKSINQNNSFFSISQLDDFPAASPINDTHDFGDDEFFYPGMSEASSNMKQSKNSSNNKMVSPVCNSRATENIGYEFSPFKNKMTSTQQNFYGG